MENSLVSVIIPTHNRKAQVTRAIESVMAQTYKNIEVIVLDDASTDGTGEAIAPFCRQYSNVVLVKNEKNLGFVKNLNKGVGLARGRYIARLDDDDLWCDVKKIEKQVGFLEQHYDYVLTGGGVVKIDVKGNMINKYLMLQNDEDIKRAILADNVFAHSTVVFRREVFVKAGGYREQFGFFADWALWLELGKMGKLYNFQEFFIHYLDREGGGWPGARDYGIRRQLLAKIRLAMKYKKYYGGWRKSLILSFASYCYSFVPMRQKVRPAVLKIRKLIFGAPPYKYF